MNIKSDKIKLLIYKKWKTDLKWFRNILPTKLKTKKNTLIEKPRMCEFWFQKNCAAVIDFAMSNLHVLICNKLTYKDILLCFARGILIDFLKNR